MTRIVSHADALFAKSADFTGEYDPCYEVLSSEVYADNGRCLKRSVVSVRDNSVELAKYSAEDFFLENLAAVGALQSDRRYTYSPSTMDMIDAVENGAAVLNDIADMNNNANNTDE